MTKKRRKSKSFSFAFIFKMKLPTKEECFKLWDEFDLPENIRQHIFLVTKISAFLAYNLEKKVGKIDFNSLEKAALLHDLDKMQTVGDNAHNHALIAYDFLLKKGYSKFMAELVKFHKLEAPSDMADRWELKILRYADAISLGDKVVSLDERFEYLKNRYPHLSKDENQHIRPLIESIEKEICNILNTTPEKIRETIKKANETN